MLLYWTPGEKLKFLKLVDIWDLIKKKKRENKYI